MFTGYIGLEFVFPKTGNTAKIVQQEGDIFGYIYTDCTLPSRVWDIDTNWLESVLNQQGKAPKRIQYELVLNAYYSNTANSIEWMKSKFYSLDSVMSNIDYFYSDNRWELGYYPACKLPAKYLPSKSSAAWCLSQLWDSPSSTIPDEYWSKVLPADEEETVVNFLFPNYTNLVSYSLSDLVTGDGYANNFLNFSSLIDTTPFITTNACKLPASKMYNSPTPTNHSMCDLEVPNTINNLITKEIIEENSPYLTQVPMYKTITGEEYIKVHQLDTAQTAVVNPPNAGDDTVYNFLYFGGDNEVVFSNGDWESGNGQYKGQYGEVPKYTIDHSTKAPCCKLSN